MEQWDDVRFFLAIARESSLSGAARTLRVDHATVGRRLTALEQRLGAKLFNRTPEGFAITSAGQPKLNQAETKGTAAPTVVPPPPSPHTTPNLPLPTPTHANPPTP